MDRIKILCGYLTACNTFADVGCDHGYIAEHMLNSGLCDFAYITDVSAKSLAKAENLLADYVADGKCKSICCDGLEKVPQTIDFAVIAGMGGEEIIKILKNAFIPKNFLFQPMKNARALRQYLLDNGCALTVDDMFFDGYKYYSVIRGARESGEQGENYTENMLAFGRDSLKNPLLKNYLSHKIERINSYLENEMTTDSKISLTAKLNFLKETLKQCN